MYFSDYYFRPLEELTDDDLIRVPGCGCCGRKGAFRELSVFQEKPRIGMVRCASCGAVTYDRILKQDKLDEIYENYTYLGEDENKASKDQITFYGKERFADHLMDLIKKEKKREEKQTGRSAEEADMSGQIKVLDFGGGDGSLAYALSERLLEEYRYEKIDITVVDYTDTPYISKNDKITLHHTFPLKSVPSSELFEYVIASAVLEHLPQPGPDFRRLVRHCADGGLLYFRAPYKYPLYRLLKRFGSTLDMLYPRHIWDLGEVWWERIPRRLGLQDQVELVASRPSIVEKSLKEHFFISLTAHMMKAPWFICHKWHYVGGWEAMYRKTADSLKN